MLLPEGTRPTRQAVITALARFNETPGWHQLRRPSLLEADLHTNTVLVHSLGLPSAESVDYGRLRHRTLHLPLEQVVAELLEPWSGAAEGRSPGWRHDDLLALLRRLPEQTRTIPVILMQHPDGGPRSRDWDRELGFINLMQGRDPSTTSAIPYPGDRAIGGVTEDPEQVVVQVHHVALNPTRQGRTLVHAGHPRRQTTHRSEGATMTTPQEVRAMGESRRVPLGTLRLDPYNPRLPVDMQGQSQADLAVHLELGFDALTVAESIASHGYFGSEPLIVIQDPTDDAAWIVVEGNRRLTALLGLVDPAVRAQFANPAPWEELALRGSIGAADLVPVVVLPDRASATPIIGFRHISGILQWQPYAQARYIARLVDEDGLDFAEVAKMIGIDRTKVGNLYRDQAIAGQARELGIETGPLEVAFSLLTVAMSTPKLPRSHRRPSRVEGRAGSAANPRGKGQRIA